ncbi:2-dehydropantoate 2-reductase [Paenibacillaceae bacterium]|nr:2-dehydropantoate 2-reductase [Paenibacillaceae bacterium]
MNFCIIGGGAIGLLYAARLARAGNQVLVLTRTAEQALRLTSDGITLLEQGGSSVIAVQAMPASDGFAYGDTAFDAVWLAVKQQHIDEEMLHVIQRAAAIMATSDASAPVLCLQNGIGHMEALRAALPHLSFSVAVTTEGALRHDMCTVSHTGIGQLWLESDEQDEEKQKMLLNTVKKAGIDVLLSNEMNIRINQKLLINAVVNPLTAIYGLRNGDLPAEPVRIALMEALFNETAAVLDIAKEDRDGEWQRLLQVCQATAQNESSMLKDVKSGRSTEIDWLNGKIAALAAKRGMAAPLNEAVTALVKAILK